MAITRDTLIKALDIIKRLQEADLNDQATLEALKKEAALYKESYDILNEPELVHAFDSVVQNAANSPAPQNG